MKTKEELNALKERIETVDEKCRELTEEELAQVSGGAVSEIGTRPGVCPDCGSKHIYQQGPYTVQNKTVWIYKCADCPWESGYCC